MSTQIAHAFAQAQKKRNEMEHLEQRTREILRDQPPEEVMSRKKRHVKNRSKERVPGERIEEIRKKLDLSNGQFSLALGFATENGYKSCFVDGKVLRMHELAAEGLLAKHNSKEHPEITFLVRIQNGKALVNAFNFNDCDEISIKGKTYLLVPVDG